MAKSIKNSIVPKKQSKVPGPTTTANFRFDYLTLKTIPFNDATLESLAFRMLDWAKNTEEVVLNKFLFKEGLDWSTLKDFMDRCPKLAKAKDYTKLILGARREEKTLYKDFDAGTMKHMQGVYDPEWREEQVFQAKLKTDMLKAQNKASTEDMLEVVKEITKTVNSTQASKDFKKLAHDPKNKNK